MTNMQLDVQLSRAARVPRMESVERDETARAARLHEKQLDQILEAALRGRFGSHVTKNAEARFVVAPGAAAWIEPTGIWAFLRVEAPAGALPAGIWVPQEISRSRLECVREVADAAAEYLERRLRSPRATLI